MEVIKISKKKLLLLLDNDDMAKYKLNENSDSKKMNTIFRKLFLDCGIGCDFFSDVLVQIFDSKSGGCEMFVTKLEESTSLGDKSKLQIKMFVYIFPDLSSIAEACKMLSPIHSGTSVAYYDSAKKNYYLMLDKDNIYIPEFNGKRCKDGAVEYLNEYCKLITTNATENLSALA